MPSAALPAGPGAEQDLGPCRDHLPSGEVAPVTIVNDDTGPTSSEQPAGGDPPETTELLYTAGQSAWLALISIVAVAGFALALVALIVANGGDGGGGGAASDGGPTGPVTEAEISATEFAFDPGDVELVADEEATVTLVNDGAVEHNWTVIEQGTTVADEAEIPDAPTVGGVETVGAGEDASAGLTLEAGTYQVICTIAGHLSAGMEGTVTATAAGA